MPSNSRAENQYYGKYRECAVVACLNNSEVEYYEDFSFSEEEKKKFMKEAKIIANYLGPHTAIYLGNHTVNESGDIKLDNGEIVELKSVSAGTGTYFNTSIYYFLKFGFDFKNYMERYGLYDALNETFGDFVSISRKNNSPVNQANSSYIRHNYEDLYKRTIVPIDTIVRSNFTKDIAEYFIHNPQNIYEFISDMLMKNSGTSKKSCPDRLIIFNYRKNSIKEIDLKHFQDNISTNIKMTDNGLVIGNIRVVFSWQNGVGLNNPTIRIFLEE